MAGTAISAAPENKDSGDNNSNGDNECVCGPTATGASSRSASGNVESGSIKTAGVMISSGE